MYNVRIFSSKISNDSAFFLTTFRTIQSVYIYSLYFRRKKLRKDFASFLDTVLGGNEQKDLDKHGSKKHLFRSYEAFLSVRHYLYDICSIRSPIISTRFLIEAQARRSSAFVLSLGRISLFIVLIRSTKQLVYPIRCTPMHQTSTFTRNCEGK